MALYHLVRIRDSADYAKEVDVARMRHRSHKKLLMPGTVVDQVEERLLCSF